MRALAAILEGTPLTTASAAVSILVALLALVLSWLGLAAARKRGNRSLYWVSMAFLVFTAKNVFSAVNVTTHQVPHDAIELVLSLFDLGIIALLFLPLVFRKRG